MNVLLRRILQSVLALLLLVTVLLAWLLGTGSGLRVTLQVLETQLAPELSIRAAEGRLAGSLLLHDVRYETEDLLFSTGTLQLDWSPAALLSGEFHIDHLAATAVRYERYTVAEDDAAPLVLPERLALPLAIRIQAASFENLVLVTAPGAEPVVIDAITLAAGFNDSQLSVQQLAVRQAQLDLHGAATLRTLDDYPVTGDLQWQLSLPGYAPLVASTVLSGSLHTLQIEQSVQPPYAMQASLQLEEPLAELQVDARVKLHDSALQQINPAWPDMQLNGSVRASGAPSALQLDGQVAVQDAVAGALQLVFAGRLETDALQVERLQLTSDTHPARLDAQGHIGLGAQPVFDFAADWSELVWPLNGSPDYQSEQGHVTLRGTADDYRLEASGDLQISGLLSGAIQLRAKSAREPGNWLIELAELTGGASQIEVAGQAGEHYDLSWSINSANLSELFPQAVGRVQGKGTIKGALPALALGAQLRGSGIRWQDLRLGKLSVEGNVQLADGQTSRLDATVSDARLAGITISTLQFNASGKPEHHKLRLQASTDQGEADLHSIGHWDGKRWAFDLEQAQLAYPGYAAWQLLAPVSGELSAQHVQLPQTCWSSGAARACLQLAGNTQAAGGRFSLSDLPAHYFSTALAPGMAIESMLAARGEFSTSSGRIKEAHVELDVTPGRLLLQGEGDDPEISLAFDAGKARLDVLGQQAKLVLQLPLSAGQGELTASARLQAADNTDWLHGALTGELSLHWPDIGIAADWLPEVSALSGMLDGQVQLAGTPVTPRLLGRLELAEASATLESAGLTLENIHLTLDGTPEGTVLFNAALDSGGGSLLGKGELNLAETSGQLQLSGEQFQVANLPEAKVYASPDLQLALSRDLVSIRGRIDIPRAQLRPRQPPASAVTVSSDQVIITAEQPEAERSEWALDADLRIVLGDEVDIDGLGLSGKLSGGVRIIDPPQQPASASGELTISGGRYQAYGQELDITTGRLLFAGGALDEPGLDIEAVRRPAADVTVGVKVRGNLRKPQFTVFSQPSMQQSEQLSWLVLGRPLEGGSDSERSALELAALSLGLGTGESIGQQIGESLGLDEVSVASEPGADVTQASLLVGKYLTPDLFVSYGMGLFEPLTTLKLRYAFSSRWKLVSETSAISSSADLVYEIERY